MNYLTLIKIVAKFLGLILPIVTPEIREALKGALQNLYEKAKATDNPWDDYLIYFLLTILNFKEKD